jgi:hypothetical protein
MGLQPEIKNWSAFEAHTSAERLIPVVTARLLGCLIRANSNEFFGTLSSRLTASRTRLGAGTLVVCFAEMEQPLATPLPFFWGFFVKFLVPLG